MIFGPPPGFVFRLLLFPVQLILALITLCVVANTTATRGADRFLLWLGFIIPFVTLGLTLFFGGPILRFKGLFQWLFG